MLPQHLGNIQHIGRDLALYNYIYIRIFFIDVTKSVANVFSEILDGILQVAGGSGQTAGSRAQVIDCQQRTATLPG